MAIKVSKEAGKHISRLMAMTAIAAHLGAFENMLESLQEFNDDFGGDDYDDVLEATKALVGHYDTVVALVQSKFDAASEALEVESEEGEELKELEESGETEAEEAE